MGTVDMMRKKYFTEKGEQTLFTRLKTLISLYEKDTTYPFKQRILGFIPLSIDSKEGHKNMINELRQILGLKEIVIIDNDHGRKEIKVIR